MSEVVVVSAHRDDAAFSLGLSIRHWLRSGHTVTVLNCFTRSNYAPFSDSGFVHENDRTSFVSALRRREDEAWRKRVGNGLRFHDLDLLDAPLRLACTADEVLAAPIRLGDRAVSRVKGAIAKLGARAAAGGGAVVGPLALGGHIDHRVVHQAVAEANAEGPFPLAQYEDLPYAARPEVDSEWPRLESGHDLRPAFACEPADDLQEAVRAKVGMADCYDSQVGPGDVRRMSDFCLRFGGRERLWVSAASVDSTLWRLDGSGR